MVDNILDKICTDIQDAGVDLVLQLPCDRIAPLLGRLSERIPYFTLSREEEGVGIAAGISLTGAKSLMIVQSSGIGNMVNAILSLTQFYNLPLPLIISQRGVYKENISAQVPMGANLTKILAAMGIEYVIYNESSELVDFQSQLADTYQNNQVKCIIFSPKICEGLPKYEIKPTKPIGNLADPKQSPTPPAHEHEIIEDPTNLKIRYEILKGLKEYLTGKAVICNMGFPSRELYTVLDQSSNFYMLGSLGLVSSIGLGVALFADSEVVVIDGDGSLLMNPNALFSIGALQPQNLTVICIDNGAYGSTGNQPTLTSENFRLEDLARASRIPNILVTDQPDTAKKFGATGPKFFKIMAKPGNGKVGTIDLTEIEIKDRFMGWLKRPSE
jgi:sulfopyruvate decarboxylase subunit beta